MRTTLTLDDDVAQRLKDLAHERGVSFKEVVNATLRAGFARVEEAEPYRLRGQSMGVRPGIDLTKANQLVAELEDEEILRKLEQRK